MEVDALTDTGSAQAAELNRQDYLAELWRVQLNLPIIGVHDDFFAAGGSSMQMIEMLMTVSNKFGKDLDFAEFFRDPCIVRLDELLAD